jgi:hypothetical protein
VCEYFNIFIGSIGAPAAKKAHLSPSANLKGQTSILSFFKASPVQEKTPATVVKEDLAATSPQLKKRRSPYGLQKIVSSKTHDDDTGSQSDDSGDPDIR